MYRRNRFRVGLMVLGAGTLFVLLILFILGGSLSGPSAKYYILFEDNVKGMVIGSRCNFQGVPIGAVHDMRFQNGQTLVTVLVDPARAVIQDVTRARMDRLLVTGQVTVELEGYHPDARRLRPGSYIKPKADPINSMKNSLPELAGEFLGLTQELKGTVERFNRLMDTNESRINKLMVNAETATTEVANRLADTLTRMDALMVQAQKTLAGFDQAARAVEGLAAGEEMRGTLTAAASALRTLEKLEARVDSVMAEVQGLLGGLRGPALTAMGSLREALEEFRGLARQLRLAPDSLLYGVSPPSAPGRGR